MPVGLRVAILHGVMRPLKDLLNFKVLRIVLSVALAATALPGCSYLLDKNKKAEPKTVSTADTACLHDTKKIVADYIEGSATVEQMDGMFECAIRAMDAFAAKTRGLNDDRYAIEELDHFFAQYLGETDGAASRLLEIALQVKSAALGGPEVTLTRAELNKVKALLNEIKVGLHGIDPHKEIIFGRAEANNSVEPEKVDQATAALTRFVEKVSTHLESNDGIAITIERLFEIVRTLRSPNPDSQLEQQALERLSSKYPPLLQSFKSIFISGPHDRVNPDEWRQFLKSAVQLYNVYLRHKYVLDGDVVGTQRTARTVKTAAEDLVNVLSEAVRRHENRIIPLQKWRELIVNIERSFGKLPLGLRSVSLEPILPKLFTHVLRPSRIPALPNTANLEQNRQVGLGDIELSALRYYVTNWMAGHEIARNLIGDRESRSGSEISQILRSAFRSVDRNTEEGRRNLTTSAGVMKKDQILQFNAILHGEGRPLLLTQVRGHRNQAPIDAPTIPVQRTEPQYSLRDLLRLNFNRLLVEIAFRSFTPDVNRARDLRGLTTDESEALFTDLRKFGFDLRVVDPRSQRSGHRTFMEANLFMSNSDGNDYINFREAVEWLSNASASGKHAMAIYDGAWNLLQQRRPRTWQDQDDIFGRKKVEITAYREYFKGTFASYFANMPGMVRFVQELNSRNRYHEFEQALENAARPLGHDDGPMDSSAMRAITPVLYYTENIFTRFDTNHSGTLENDEVWAIFPMMRNTLRDISNGQATGERIQKMIFASLLLNGQPPPDDWTKFVQLPVDGLIEWIRQPSIDRLGILKLIGAIAATSRNNALKEIKAVYTQRRNQLPEEFALGSVAILDRIHSLSRCSQDSLVSFRAVMKQQARAIFSGSGQNGYDADVFVQRLQHVIQNHPSLNEQCLPMLRVR